MTNPRLKPDEIAEANALLAAIRAKLDQVSAGDKDRLFAYRRRLIVKLTIDERGTAAWRNKLKAMKMREQNGVCPLCEGLRGPLPLKYAELDRRVASHGYSPENTRLVHHECHVDDQKRKRYV